MTEERIEDLEIVLADASVILSEQRDRIAELETENEKLLKTLNRVFIPLSYRFHRGVWPRRWDVARVYRVIDAQLS